MIEHGDVLELIAASIDFELSAEERWELEAHLTTCTSCRRMDAQMRADAAAFAAVPAPRLDPARARQILAASMRPPRPGPSLRVLGIAAVLAVLGGGALAAGTNLFREHPRATELAVRPSVDVIEPRASAGASDDPGGVDVEPSTRPARTGEPPGQPAPDPQSALIARGDARLASIMLQPGPGGGVYVLVGGARHMLALLGKDGRPRQGWPLRLRDVDSCALPSAASDGSVRVVCGSGAHLVRLFAFDTDGTPLPGWPVVLRDEPLYDDGRVVLGSPALVGNRLAMLAHTETADADSTQPGDNWIVTVARDGTVKRGEVVKDPDSTLGWKRALGSDGVAALVGYPTTDAGAGESTVIAFDRDGERPGWPVRLDGVASTPTFGPGGMVQVQLGSLEAPLSRLVVLDGAGQETGRSPEMAADGRGESGGRDMGPTVDGGGHGYVLGNGSGTVVLGFQPSGEPMPGWPYQTSSALAVPDPCSDADTGCVAWPAPPVTGPTGLVYLLHPPADDRGGRVVAINQSAEVRAGWPVDLKRTGAEFWSVVCGPDGTAFVLAIEPERAGAYSGTVLAIAPDSTVRWTSTVVEP